MLIITTLLANSVDEKLVIFSYFSQETGFDIWLQICMKCQILFSGKNKKYISLCRKFYPDC